MLLMLNFIERFIPLLLLLGIVSWTFSSVYILVSFYPLLLVISAINTLSEKGESYGTFCK